MKSILKKMLLALMVGVGMIGAVGITQVQAQTQGKYWERVGDFCSYDTRNMSKLCGDPNTICAGQIALFAPGWAKWPGVIVTYAGSWRMEKSTAPLVCAINTKPNWMPNTQIQLYCPDKGTYSNDRPDGCYKQVDNCPTGTVKGEGDVCAV